MPYYLCIHGIIKNEDWNGCTYIKTFIENTNEIEEEYSLRDAYGNLI